MGFTQPHYNRATFALQSSDLFEHSILSQALLRSTGWRVWGEMDEPNTNPHPCPNSETFLWRGEGAQEQNIPTKSSCSSH